MIMTAVQLLERNGSPSRDEIRYALDGNLCRCTGYSHIVDAVEHAAKKGWMTPLGSGSVMAYLVRDARSRSPYWYGVYLVVSPGGQRRWVRKSTKKRKRSEAKEILDAWQNTADRAAAGNLDQARIREIVLETVERVTGKRTDSPSVSEWLERWIRTEKDAVGVRTMTRYAQIVRDFLRADLAEKTITFVQRKTGSSVQVPVHQDLYDYLVVLPRSDSPKRPVFPRLFNKPGTGKSGLSMAFKREDCVKGWNATH
jgi:[2Fe-2S] binding domain